VSKKSASFGTFTDRVDLLENILKDEALERSINRKINDISNLMALGYQPESISKKMGIRKNELDILFDFARARLSIRHKYSKYDQLYMDPYSASYSTPENVAKFRAERLKGKSILDLGCGAGMASIFLSMYSRVDGIDMSQERVLMARINNKKYSGKAKFEVGDGTKLQIREGEYDIIYSDPLRSSSSMERSMKELEPNPDHVMDIYRDSVKGFVFDLPPFMNPEKIKKIHGTLQYLSVDGNISRLTLYSCGESSRTFEATSLNHNYSYKSDHRMKPESGDKVMHYLFIPDASLFYSGLHGNYCNELDLKIIREEKRKAIYTGDKLIQDFIGDTYEVISVVEPGLLKETLKRENIGRVILRYDSPNYYGEQKTIESYLEGEDVAYIFSFKDSRIVSKKIK
jgi:SAM-dependent methyltransferase